MGDREHAGGDLTAAPKGKSISFLVAALKDPIGADLDRVQVIKGWLDKDGKTQERIYDVAVSGDRKIGADGRCGRFMRNRRRQDKHRWLAIHHDRCARVDMFGPVTRGTGCLHPVNGHCGIMLC